MLKTFKRNTRKTRVNRFNFMSGVKLAIIIAVATQTMVIGQTVPLSAFQARTQAGKSGLSLPYRIFVPKNYDSAKRYPLVLCLHGVGESGTDNAKQVTAYQLAPLWAADSNQSKHPSFVVAPQCPVGNSWSNMGAPIASRSIANTAQVVLEILDSLGREFNLDPDRIYIAGLSLGGYGTWEMIERFPGRFAAAVPICGGGDTASAARIKNVPIWAFHGDADPTVPVANSRNMIAAIRKAGGSPKYTEFPGVGHNSWVNALKEPSLPEWVFSQALATTSVLPPRRAAAISLILIQGEGLHVRIDGRRSADSRANELGFRVPGSLFQTGNPILRE